MKKFKVTLTYKTGEVVHLDTVVVAADAGAAEAIAKDDFCGGNRNLSWNEMEDESFTDIVGTETEELD